MNEQTTDKKTILLVEDDELIRDLYTHVLTDPRLVVDTAQDGNEAYEKIHTNTYDLILLDMLLPGMDGNIILQKLTGPDESKKRNIVLLTNLDQDLSSDVTNRANIKGFLIKSQIDPNDLKKKVVEYLGIQTS